MEMQEYKKFQIMLKKKKEGNQPFKTQGTANSIYNQRL